MRNVVYAINITVDGCCDHTRMIADEELHEYFTELLRTGDLLVYGRKTYELMVPFWPDVAKNQSMDKTSNEFAKVFDSLDKIVVSRTLSSVADTKTRILHSGVADEIRSLKQQPGKKILLGGVDLPSQLMEQGLVDEFYFVVQPVLGGDHSRLFKGANLQEAQHLKLMDSRVLKSGSIALHYVKK